MTSTPGGTRPSVAVVGGGAAGTLTCVHLLRTAARRSSALDVTMIEPAARWGRGTAYGTTDEAHLLNVPAAGLSAHPEDPAHFVRWAARQLAEPVDPTSFLSRTLYGIYLDETLRETVAATLETSTFRHCRARVSSARPTGRGVTVRTTDGRQLAVDGVVLAVGQPPVGSGWAPESLRRSAFFVEDPWRAGALDVVRRDRVGPADVLLVGTGLTMVDVTLSLLGSDARPDRRLHAVSRSGRRPRAHRTTPGLPAIPEVADWGQDLPTIRARATDYIRQVSDTTGDWRPAVDGLRFRLSALWERLGEPEREEFLREDAGRWNVLRHRMPPSSAAALAALESAGRLGFDALQVVDATPLPQGGLAVSLSDRTRRDVGWVVNCTGPGTDVRALGDPLLDDLLDRRAGRSAATVATAGMGFCTRYGRLVDSTGSTDAPLWALGALRRGELWESTAVPEIRTQAAALAASVLDAVAPLPRRLADGRLVSGHHPVARPRDPLGLPLSTTSSAAAAFNAGLHKVMTLQSGAEDHLREAVRMDPDFAVAHAALAMLGHEAGAVADVTASLAAARDAVQRRGDARERSLVEVVANRVDDVRGNGALTLMNHIAGWPRDVLAVSAAVPTIAFSGVIDVQREAWDLVEGLGPAYGDHWWYLSLLAFVRQDQQHYEEAGLLAETALACEPSSGHAVHALTHVLYETGQHEAGRTWLDHWVAESGRSASHRAHFSWHAALHELALGDTEAVRRRYSAQLAPPTVSGIRALVDSASLLWRWRVTVEEWVRPAGDLIGEPGAAPAVGPVLDAVPPSLLQTPETPFVALHAALALAAADDADGLAALARHCRSTAHLRSSSEVSAVCDALEAVTERRWDDAVSVLDEVLPTLHRVGGSAAQREVVEETLLLCLVNSGGAERARDLLRSRLERRLAPLDRLRLDALTPQPSRA